LPYIGRVTFDDEVVRQPRSRKTAGQSAKLGLVWRGKGYRIGAGRQIARG
jgi:hypothetical protein